MKKLLCIVFLGSAIGLAAQPKKDPKMAATTSPGYYVVAKGDTVKGEVRNNPEDPTEFYTTFMFKPAKGGKLMPVSANKAKAYGFDDRHFVQIKDNGADIYVEVLARGRLNFYEFRYNGKIDGLPAVESAYFVQDNMAEGEDIKLRELKKINNKFYKKELKPYMKDQPVIWADMDKFTFNKEAVTNSIKEFNKFYVITNSGE
ncbi:MAG TPA: hypothetical protein PLQ93_03565 [Bacteroidia bacterium]|nr:hypothetical protein [Bacteroidia bacterium]